MVTGSSCQNHSKSRRARWQGYDLRGPPGASARVVGSVCPCYNAANNRGGGTIPQDNIPGLTREEVEHVTLLARVGLSQEEIERYRHQLSRVLEHFQVLAKLDTEGIPPTAQVISLQNVMRGDEAAPSASREDVMANAPQAEDGFFKVRAVLEE